ncbi:MAG: acyl carrier protein [bacterium]
MKDKIRQYILDYYMMGSSPDTLDDDASLLETGVIDSTGVLDLIAYLEEQFQITVEDSEMIPQNLDSVNHLCHYVERKKEAAFSPAASN